MLACATKQVAQHRILSKGVLIGGWVVFIRLISDCNNLRTSGQDIHTVTLIADPGSKMDSALGAR